MDSSETRTDSVNLFEAMTEAEEPEPDCQISGCDRPGEVPRKIRDRNSEDEAFEHYLCRFHYRVLLGVKIAIAILVVAVFLAALFNL